MKISPLTLALGGGLAALGVVAVSQRKRIVAVTTSVLDSAKQQAFRAVIPARTAKFADVILRVASEEGISPFLIAAFMERESRSGDALTPKGPEGTGDFTPRKSADGSIRTSPAGKGWGYGLMQIDYESFSGWLSSHDWQDPYTNIQMGVRILKDKMAFFTKKVPAGSKVAIGPKSAEKRGVASGKYPDPRPLSGNDVFVAGVAAYNSGESNVLMSLAAGVNPDKTTAGGDYSASVLATAARFASASGAA